MHEPKSPSSATAIITIGLVAIAAYLLYAFLGLGQLFAKFFN
jgi:hypothetical protein